MDALLIALVAGLLAEVGGRTQLACQAMAAGNPPKSPVVILIFILMVSLSVSAIAGLLVAPFMPPEARILMLGLALSFAGIAQLTGKGRDHSARAPAGVIGTAMRLGSAHFVDGTPFLVFAIAARTANAPMAAIGALSAVLVLCLPALLIPKDWDQPRLFIRLRRIAAAILIVAGIWAALTGLRLI